VPNVGIKFHFVSVLIEPSLTVLGNQVLNHSFRVIAFSSSHLVHVRLDALSAQTLVRPLLLFLFLLDLPTCCTVLAD